MSARGDSMQRKKDMVKAEQIYRMLFDAKTQTPTEMGLQHLSAYSIKPS